MLHIPYAFFLMNLVLLFYYFLCPIQFIFEIIEFRD